MDTDAPYRFARNNNINYIICMSFLHKCEARVSSVKRESHIFHAGKRRLKYVDLYKIEGKNCRETNHIRHPLQEG